MSLTEKISVRPVVDPGFWSGGGQENYFASLPMEWSRVVWMKWVSDGQGPGPALGPWKFLGFSLLNMHSPTFPGTFLCYFWNKC